MDERTRMLRSQGKVLKPILQIGKSGLTPGSIDLIDRELSEKHLIKVKLNKGAVGEGDRDDRKEMIAQIASRTGAQIIEQVGSVVVLYRA